MKQTKKLTLKDKRELALFKQYIKDPAPSTQEKYDKHYAQHDAEQTQQATHTNQGTDAVVPSLPKMENIPREGTT